MVIIVYGRALVGAMGISYKRRLERSPIDYLDGMVKMSASLKPCHPVFIATKPYAVGT